MTEGVALTLDHTGERDITDYAERPPSARAQQAIDREDS